MAIPKKRPNILFLFTDQHRLSALGAYGPTPCQTPHLDRLASEGVLFRNAYTTCPVCTPARASIMTGQYPHNHGMLQNVEDVGSPVCQLPDGPHLLSRQLQQSGYQLGYTGKWHLGSYDTHKFGTPLQPCLPKDVGFSGQNFPGHGDGGWDYPEFQAYLEHLKIKHKLLPWSESTTPYRPEPIEQGGILEQSIEGTVCHFLADHTIQLIDAFEKSEDGKPWFLWHNFWGPHSPYLVCREYLERYRNVEIPPWPNYDWPVRSAAGPHQLSITPQLLWEENELTWDDWAMAIRYYYAFTTMIDEQIGRIVEHLRQRGFFENTMILFSADHGESLGDHGGIYNKGWTHFEETHRIPLLLLMPDKTGSGREIESLVSLVDIYPTILDMAGLPTTPSSARPSRPDNWPYEVSPYPDGESLLPLVRGENIQWRNAVVSEFHGLFDNSCIMRTVRTAQYKYGYTFLGNDELYNLEDDPYEQCNVINQPKYKEVLQDMRMHLWNWMQDTQDWATCGFHHTRFDGRKM